MRFSKPIEGVYLSSVINLKERYGTFFHKYSNLLRLYNPEEISNPLNIKFALTWEPTSDAFLLYPNIQMVSSIGAGVDSILRCKSLPWNIIITRIRDRYQAYTMAGFVVWQIIWHHRKIKQYLFNEINHEWKWVECTDVSDCTVGILGFGTMGEAVVNAIIPLGYNIVVACRTERKNIKYQNITIKTGEKSIENTAKKSNILVNLLPLTSATRFVLNYDLFSVMPRRSVLIHVGRGEHLVEEDLTYALDKGILSAASIDVFSNEPLPFDHPFWDDQRIMVTPHIACETDVETVAEQVSACVEDMINHKIPRYAIDREREY